MKKIYFVLAGLLLVSLIPLLADASTTKRTGNNISLSADEIVEGNFYGVGNSVAISGEIEGDAVLVGGTVITAGKIAKDALIFGGTVSVDGEVIDDVRIVAGEVTISGLVGGSLSIVARKINILSTANIMGDVMIYGAEAVVEGEIGGFLYGMTDSLRIDGTVLAGVDVTSQNLDLGNRSNIEGNITYISGEDLRRASEAQVGGTIVRNSPAMTEVSFPFRSLVFNFSILLFTSLVIYLVARRHIERFVSYPMFDYHFALRALLLGFIFIFLPVAIAVLFASVLGILIGIMALFIYILLLAITIPIMSYVVAKLVMKFFKHKKLTLMHIILAVAVVVVLAHLPYLGLLVFLVLYLFTLGVILTLLSMRIRK